MGGRGREIYTPVIHSQSLTEWVSVGCDLSAFNFSYFSGAVELKAGLKLGISFLLHELGFNM